MKKNSDHMIIMMSTSTMMVIHCYDNIQEDPWTAYIEYQRRKTKQHKLSQERFGDMINNITSDPTNNNMIYKDALQNDEQ